MAHETVAAKFPDRVKLQRLALGGVVRTMQTDIRARVSPSFSKDGHSHTILVRYRTDIRIGDIIRVGALKLEVVQFADWNGHRLFLKIDADAERADLKLRVAARHRSLHASEGE